MKLAIRLLLSCILLLILMPAGQALAKRRDRDEVVVRGLLERGDKDRVVIGSLGSHPQSMLLRG